MTPDQGPCLLSVAGWAVWCRQGQGLVLLGFPRTHSVLEATVPYRGLPGSGIRAGGSASEGLTSPERISSSYIPQTAEIVLDFYVKIGPQKG